MIHQILKDSDLIQLIKCGLHGNESPIVALAINTQSDVLLLMHSRKTVNFVIHCIDQMCLLGVEEQ